MFCPNCGQTLAEGARFCANCGNSLTPAQPAPAADYYMMNSMQQYQLQKSAARQGELRTLDSLVMHFSQKQAQYDEYDNVCESVNLYARGAKKGLIVWGAIITFMGFITTLVGFVDSSTEIAPIGILFLIPGLLMIAGGILMQVANRKKYKRALQRCQQLSDELYHHYMAYPNCPIGHEYSNPHILVALRKTFQSGRADTIKECLNLMISDANQRAIENYLEQLQNNVAQIQRNTAQAARASTATAVFMAASFFS